MKKEKLTLSLERFGFDVDRLLLEKMEVYGRQDKEGSENELQINFLVQKYKDKCFIATSCYGSYNAKEVLVLRQYRDIILLNFFWGKAFVNFYYFSSPAIARLLDHSFVLRNLIKRYFLDPVVKKIQKKYL